MDIKGLDFIRTCVACPEQYDVFKDGKQVGYVRYRFGNLTCECPDVSGTLVYSQIIDESGWSGVLPDESRIDTLECVADNILNWINHPEENDCED